MVKKELTIKAKDMDIRTDIKKAEEKLLPGERIDSLDRNGYHIIQNPDLFCFGIDAVLLAEFAKLRSGGDVLDMCCGNGVVPLLMLARGYDNIQGGQVRYTGIEIQKKSAMLAARNAELNNVSDSFKCICADIKDASKILGTDRFAAVTCNPPYMAKGSGLVNPEDAKAIARHELTCTFDDIAREAAAVLRASGSFFLVHRPRRLVELVMILSKYNMEPKRMRCIHSYKDKEASMILIEAVKGGGSQMIIEPPLIVYEKEGEYTKEVRCLYG